MSVDNYLFINSRIICKTQRNRDLYMNPSKIFNQSIVAGEYVDSQNGSTVDVLNPLDGKVITTTPDLSKAQILEAIDSAHEAQKTWRKTRPQERRAILRKWHELLLGAKDQIAELMVNEQGKPLAETLGEVAYSASYIDFYADEAIRIYGETLPAAFPNADVNVEYEPVGVVGIITPWNFPIAMFLRKVAPALAAGCTCIVKPDENTPLSALLAVKLAHDAGVPPGVLNCVTGDGPMIGKAFCESKKVDKISFTGSVEVGRILARQAADTLKRVTLELGGDAPFIVFDDADLDQAVQGLMAAKFRNMGQTCVCANRVLVQKSVLAKFQEKLIPTVNSMKLGSGLDAGVAVGPMIHEKALSSSIALCERAVAEGASLVVGGKRDDTYPSIMQPTIMSNVRPDMEIAKKELFAPIVTLIPFDTEEEAISIANNTEFGLASYFYSESAKRIFRVKNALEYGMVGVNTGIVSSALTPFGGIKQSGYGREGSRHGLFEYLYMKYINLNHGG